MKRIIVEVDADGSIEIEVNGYSGSSCREATEWLEQELGVVTEHKLKPDYYRQAGINQQRRIRNGRRDNL